MSLANSNEIKTRLSFNFPVDPLNIATMADYDIALINFLNWFEYDEQRRAVPGLIQKWKFDDKLGGYEFTIDQAYSWSNGDSITPADLIFNLDRAIKLKTTYGNALKSIIDLKKTKQVNSKILFLKILNGKPSDAFFQRMGSIFLAILHPSNVNSELAVVNNKVTAGRYVLEAETSDQLQFQRNSHFPSKDINTANKIIIKKPSSQASSIHEFLNEKSWENISQLSTMVDPETANMIVEKKLPYWSRGSDRVSLLKPMPGKKIAARKSILAKIRSIKSDLEKLKFTFNVKTAYSLQPLGYPLFKEVKDNKLDKAKLEKVNINILAPDTVATRYQIELLNPLFVKKNIFANWVIVPKSDFVGRLNEVSDIDFVFFDFGVADPEATTWMSLIFKMKMIYLTESEEKEFDLIVKKNSKSIDEKLKLFLEKLSLNNFYLPIFHFSTLSIGHKNLNFANIKALDETVDYSKITFK